MAGWAQEERKQPLQEVFQTELVYPQEKREMQLTLAPRFASAGEADVVALPFKLEYGLTDCWQVELEWDSLMLRAERLGPDASGVGAPLGLRRDADDIRVAAMLTYEFDLSRKDE